MAKEKDKTFEIACPDCGAMIRIDAATGLVVSHTSAPRKRMFEDLETAAKAMREQDERKESIFRQSMDAEKNKEDLFEKKFAEALRKAKDAPEGKPLREFDLDWGNSGLGRRAEEETWAWCQFQNALCSGRRRPAGNQWTG
jgi:hypothetical protein